MQDHGFLHQALVYLAAGVIAVPLFKRLGLGSVLDYLIAGMARLLCGSRTSETIVGTVETKRLHSMPGRRYLHSFTLNPNLHAQPDVHTRRRANTFRMITPAATSDQTPSNTTNGMNLIKYEE